MLVMSIEHLLVFKFGWFWYIPFLVRRGRSEKQFKISIYF